MFQLMWWFTLAVAGEKEWPLWLSCWWLGAVVVYFFLGSYCLWRIRKMTEVDGALKGKSPWDWRSGGEYLLLLLYLWLLCYKRDSLWWLPVGAIWFGIGNYLDGRKLRRLSGRMEAPAWRIRGALIVVFGVAFGSYAFPAALAGIEWNRYAAEVKRLQKEGIPVSSEELQQEYEQVSGELSERLAQVCRCLGWEEDGGGHGDTVIKTLWTKVDELAGERLSGDFLSVLNREVFKTREAWPRIADLAASPERRFKLKIRGADTLMPHLTPLRNLMYLEMLRFLDAANSGDRREAWRIWWESGQLLELLEMEPFALSFLVWRAMGQIRLNMLQRVLSDFEPASEEELRILQREMSEYLGKSRMIFLSAMRGEFLLVLEDESWRQLREELRHPRGIAIPARELIYWRDRRIMLELTESAKEWKSREMRSQLSRLPGGAWWAAYSGDTFVQIVELAKRMEFRYRGAVGAMALERYRRRSGSIPEGEREVQELLDGIEVFPGMDELYCCWYAARKAGKGAGDADLPFRERKRGMLRVGSRYDVLAYDQRNRGFVLWENE